MALCGADAACAGPLDNVATCSYIRAVKTVGVRELKNRLSEYLRLVRRGERVLVTDRGQVVAELRRPGGPTPERGKSRRAEVYPTLAPLVPDGTARALLDEERGER
jgi:antitoxin (DNA-binding transcriptional repressor) of toxin-antitoxin stability system